MEIKEFLNKNKDKMIDDLTRLVAHNSIYSEDEKPFGKANRAVLDEALKLMSDNGLKTNNLDYYCGYGEAGEGDKVIGILAHLDIVPAGEGWKSDPFTLLNKDDVLYGRGVSDDKGAVIASLYALKYLIEEKYPFKKRVRLITGCNEESGSKCIEHYVEKEGQIDMGFTPDGNFPGIFAEKGMIGGIIVSNNSKIINIKGGDASNIVPKKVNVEVPINSYDESTLNEFFRDHDIEYNIIKSDESIRLTVFGKSAHASLPDEGINAIAYLMEGLYRAEFNDELVAYFHDKIALCTHGEKLGLDVLKDEYTDFTMNVGLIRKEGEKIIITLDNRFPVTRKIEDVKPRLLETLNLGNNHFEVSSSVEPLFFSLDDPMIKALKAAYEKVSGDDSPMMAIGGGTYAKAMPNCIAFGCEFNGEENHIHDANECLKVSSLLKQVEIYVEAIKNLNEEL